MKHLSKRLWLRLRPKAIWLTWTAFRLFVPRRRGFEIIRAAVDPAVLDTIRAAMPATSSGLQSAVGQVTSALVASLKLESIAQRYLGRHKFDPENSSCRLQQPERLRALNAH